MLSLSVKKPVGKLAFVGDLSILAIEQSEAMVLTVLESSLITDNKGRPEQSYCARLFRAGKQHTHQKDRRDPLQYRFHLPHLRPLELALLVFVPSRREADRSAPKT
jgi:hypothetical protein